MPYFTLYKVFIMSFQSRNLTAVFYFIQDLYHFLSVSQSYCRILLYTRSLSFPFSLAILLPYFTLYKIFIISFQSRNLTAVFYFIQDLYHFLSVSQSYCRILLYTRSLSFPHSVAILLLHFTLYKIFIISFQSRNLTAIFYFIKDLYHFVSVSQSYCHILLYKRSLSFRFSLAILLPFFTLYKIFIISFQSRNLTAVFYFKQGLYHFVSVSQSYCHILLYKRSLSFRFSLAILLPFFTLYKIFIISFQSRNLTAVFYFIEDLYHFLSVSQSYCRILLYTRSLSFPFSLAILLPYFTLYKIFIISFQSRNLSAAFYFIQDLYHFFTASQSYCRILLYTRSLSFPFSLAILLPYFTLYKIFIISFQSRNLTAAFYFIQDLYHFFTASQSYCRILLYTRSLSFPFSLAILLPYFTLYKIFIISFQSRNLTAVFYFIQDLYHVLSVSQSYCRILLYTRSLSCPFSLAILLPYFTLYKIFIISFQSRNLTAVFYFIQDLYHFFTALQSYCRILLYTRSLSFPFSLAILLPYFTLYKIFIISFQSRKLTAVFYFIQDLYHFVSVSQSYCRILLYTRSVSFLFSLAILLPYFT